MYGYYRVNSTPVNVVFTSGKSLVSSSRTAVFRWRIWANSFFNCLTVHVLNVFSVVNMAKRVPVLAGAIFM